RESGADAAMMLRVLFASSAPGGAIRGGDTGVEQLFDLVALAGRLRHRASLVSEVVGDRYHAYCQSARVMLIRAPFRPSGVFCSSRTANDFDVFIVAQPISENVAGLKTCWDKSGLVNAWEKASTATIRMIKGGNGELGISSSQKSPG